MQTKIAIQMVGLLNESELMAFATEFDKLLSSRVTITRPKRKKFVPNIPEMAFELLRKHRAKHGIPTQGNLHTFLDVAGIPYEVPASERLQEIS